MRDRWYVFNLATNRITTLMPKYCDGLAETVTPMPGDYNGDGRADYALYCNFDGQPAEWEIEYSSGDITSQPITKSLTITFSGEKTIKTGHTGKTSIETAAMLTAIKELEKKVSLQR